MGLRWMHSGVVSLIILPHLPRSLMYFAVPRFSWCTNAVVCWVSIVAQPHPHPRHLLRLPGRSLKTFCSTPFVEYPNSRRIREHSIYSDNRTTRSQLHYSAVYTNQLYVDPDILSNTMCVSWSRYSRKGESRTYFDYLLYRRRYKMFRRVAVLNRLCKWTVNFNDFQLNAPPNDRYTMAIVSLLVS